MISFGYRLKQLRVEKDLNQSELGKQFNVEKGTISNWENNNRFPDKDMLGLIADYFNVSVDFLLGRSDVKNISDMQANEKLSPEIKTIAAHLDDKALTPHKIKMIKRYIDDLFDEFDD